MSDDSLDTHSRAPSGRAVIVLVLLFCLYVLAAVDRQILAVMVDPIRERFALSDARFGVLAGFAFALIYGAAAFPAARIADRYRRVTLIATGLALWSLFTGAFALARSWWQLVVCRMGVGLGEACLSPAAVSLLADYFPARNLGKAVALYVLAVPVGNGATGLLGSALLAHGNVTRDITLPGLGVLQPWQALLLLLSGVGFVLLLLFMLAVSEPSRGHASEDRRSCIAVDHSLGGLWRMLRTQSLVFAAVALPLLTSAVMYFGVGNWIPSYFIRGAEANGADAAELLFYWGLTGTAAGAIGVMTGGVLGDMLCARHPDGMWRMLTIGTALLGFGYSSFALAATPQMALMLLVPGVFGNGILQAAGITALLKITPDHRRAQVSALFFLMVNLVGAGLGPFWIPWLSDAAFEGDASLGGAIATTAVITSLVSLSLLTLSTEAGRRQQVAIASTAP